MPGIQLHCIGVDCGGKGGKLQQVLVLSVDFGSAIRRRASIPVSKQMTGRCKLLALLTGSRNHPRSLEQIVHELRHDLGPKADKPLGWDGSAGPESRPVN